MIIKTKLIIGDKINKDCYWSDQYNYFFLIYFFGLLIHSVKINNLSHSEARDIFGYDLWLKAWLVKQQNERKLGQ